VPRQLGKNDYVYRVIDPEHRDENGPLAIAFQDPGKDYASLSFFVERAATPSDALAILSQFSRAKKLCGTRGTPPSAEQMYDHGYRVARLPAKFILKAIGQPEENDLPEPGRFW
jgi:hypothetical protein